MNLPTQKTVGRLLAGGSLFGFGLVIGAFSTVHVTSTQEPVVGRALGVLAIVGLAVPICTGGMLLLAKSDNFTMRTFGWSLAGLVPLVVFAVLIVRYQWDHGITLAEPLVVVLWVAGIGAVGGLVTGVYDVRQRRSHRHHRESAKRLGAIFDAAPVPMIEYEPDGTIRHWNDAATRVFGWEPDAVLGKRVPVPFDQSDCATLRDRVLSGEGLSTVEVTCETKSGTSLDLLLSTAPVYGKAGLTAIVAVLVDVTEKYQQRDRLELFRTLIDRSNDAIFVVDAESGSFHDVNETACDRLGYGREELLDMSVTDVETTLSSTTDWRDHLETVRAEGTVLYEGSQERKDGTTLPVEVNIAHVPLDREYTVAIARDMTDQRARERELAQFKKAIEHAGHAVYITDTDGTIEYANPAFGAITGYEPEAVIGQDPSILQSGEHSDTYYNRLWSAITDGRVWEEEITNQRKSGGLYTAWQTIAPIYAESEIAGYVAIQTDMTAQQRREQRITVLNRLLRHNLRTAVNIIAGRAAQLRGTDGEDDLLADIEHEATRLEQLSQKAHEVEKAIDRIGSLNTPVHIVDILEGVVAEQSEKWPDAVIDIEAPEGEHLPVDINIEPVVTELVDNALRHADRAEPNLHITVRTDPPSGQISIDFADNGPGIPEHERAALRNGVETPLQHGSGLGLWLAKWVTASVGGKLSITDNEPRGNVATITVPRQQGPETGTESAEQHPESTRFQV